MFTDLKPYPTYVDSGNQWFGRLPVAWETSRLRGVSQFLVSNVDKLTHEDERPVRLCNYVDVYKNEFITDRPGYMTASASDDEIRRFRVRVDDVAITKDSESWTDIGVPAYVAQEADDLVCGYHLGLLRTRKDRLSGAYLFRALQVPAIATQFHVAAGGVTRYGLSQDDIRSASVPIPSLSEQAAIVKYLGHANARIDRAIAAKRRLIALLDEQKQAVINQAVTRGLDPNVSMKASGIPWIGQIPVHWPVAALRQRYSQSLGKMLDSSRIVGNDLLPYLRNTDVQWDRINMVDLPEMDISEAEFDRYTLEAGDLLVCEGGDVGRAAIWGNVERVGYQKALHRLRPGDANEDVPRYLLYGLRVASKAGAFSDGHVSTIAHLTGEKLRAHRFAWPSAAEQQSIVDHLDSSTAATNRTIDRVSREIELLREFRTRLTADVVTGQLDIRDAAALLPELDPAELVSDVGADEDDLDVQLAESLEQVDA